MTTISPSSPAKSDRKESDATLKNFPTQKHKSERNTVKLSPQQRWDDLIGRIRFQTTKTDSLREKEKPMARWRRALFLITVINGRNEFIPFEQEEEPEKKKALIDQHWLEVIDPKHRYGSNLKPYHQKWVESETRENFFYWLDKGEGKDLTLKACPRGQLEEERVKYLSVEERLQYLVDIKDGVLSWNHSGKIIDTFDHENTRKKRRKEDGTSSNEDGLDNSQSGMTTMDKNLQGQKHPDYLEESSDEEKEREEDSKRRKKEKKKFKRDHYDLRPSKNPMKPSNILQLLLKKTLLPNTWIFVTDEEFNLYVGPKETGKFQHSSFLSGGRVTSAGLLKIQKGRLVSLSPLSGHYRCTTDYFDKLMEIFKEKGVDVKSVKIGESYVALKGLEKWKETKEQIKEGFHSVLQACNLETAEGNQDEQKEIQTGWKADGNQLKENDVVDKKLSLFESSNDSSSICSEDEEHDVKLRNKRINTEPKDFAWSSQDTEDKLVIQNKSQTYDKPITINLDKNRKTKEEKEEDPVESMGEAEYDIKPPKKLNLFQRIMARKESSQRDKTKEQEQQRFLMGILFMDRELAHEINT